MTTKPMYDAKLSEITNRAVWDDRDGKITLSFPTHKDENGRQCYAKRVIASRYFSNFSVDTVRYNNKRYLIDSQVELIESHAYRYN